VKINNSHFRCQFVCLEFVISKINTDVADLNVSLIVPKSNINHLFFQFSFDWKFESVVQIFGFYTGTRSRSSFFLFEWWPRTIVTDFTTNKPISEINSGE